MSTSQTDLLSPEFLTRLESLELVSKKILRGNLKGERRSKRKGQSVEFSDYRNYTVGDDLRFIDWNTYARLDRLFIKIFLEEEDLHFYTLIDNSVSMRFGDPSKLYYAKQIAAAMGFIGLKQSDRVVIETTNQDPKERSPRLRGRASLWRMLEHIENINETGTTDLYTSVKNFVLRNSSQGVLILISDLMDKSGYEEALRFLSAQQMDVYVIHLLSGSELEPELEGDLRLIDSEDDDVAEITVTGSLMQNYQDTLNAFINGAREFCTRRGMNYMLADTRQPFEKLVTNYFKRRGLVR